MDTINISPMGSAMLAASMLLDQFECRAALADDRKGDTARRQRPRRGDGVARDGKQPGSRWQRNRSHDGDAATMMR